MAKHGFAHLWSLHFKLDEGLKAASPRGFEAEQLERLMPQFDQVRIVAVTRTGSVATGQQQVEISAL
jgi:hypothetical protein